MPLDYDDDDFYERDDAVDGFGVVIWGALMMSAVLAVIAVLIG